MGLRERLRRLKREAERSNAPTLGQHLAATRHETARRLRGAYERLARIGDVPTTPHPGRDRDLLADDTPERAEADRRIVEAWTRAHGTPDIKGAADAARARLLTSVRRE